MLARTTPVETAEDLEALGHEKIAEGHALLAAARRKGVQRSIDDVIPVEVAAKELDIRPRVLTDEERRGRITLGHAGRKRVVSRSELSRWLASRRTKTPAAIEDSPREAARKAVAARTGRSA